MTYQYNVLTNLFNFVNNMNAENTFAHKREVILFYSSKYPVIITLISMILNPNIKFNITSKAIDTIKQYNDIIRQYGSLLNLLIALKNKDISGDCAVASCKLFINDYIDFESLILKCIDKKLNIGMSYKTLCKVIESSGQVKSEGIFEVALAKQLTGTVPPGHPNIKWWVQRKLDGVRIITEITEKGILFYSRTGKLINTLDNLKSEIIKMNLPINTVLDGEVCAFSENKESFKGIMKNIRRKNFTMKDPHYFLFDILPLEVFHKGIGGNVYGERFLKLRLLLDGTNGNKFKNLHLVPCYTYTQSNLLYMQNAMASEGWEGLMFRADVQYECGRTKYLLKYKFFKDVDLTCIGITKEPITYFKNGIKVQRLLCSALVFKYKGNILHVGSGLTMTQRKAFIDNPALIIGKIVCVKYFEETTNHLLKKSLRFPIVKHIYGYTREV